MSRINGASFADALGDLLNEYHGKVVARVNDAGKKAVKDIENRTKRTAPKRSGDYRENITSGLKEERRTGNVYAWYVRSPHHRLTHLLVHGHRTRNGGRTRPNAFLENAVNEVLPEYERAVENAAKEAT